MKDTLFAERKLAIMQIKQGKTQEEVAHSLNRSPAWVAKWYKRFKEKGWQGLKEASRAPKQQQFQLWNSPIKNRLNFKLNIHKFEHVAPTVK